jgi:hypothetical protein
MAYKRTAPAGLIPVGFQTISLSNSTAVGLNSTLGVSTFLRISVETQAARFRDDGTDPALTTGVLLGTGFYEFPNNTADLKFQRSTGTSKISIAGYRRPGDPAS